MSHLVISQSCFLLGVIPLRQGRVLSPWFFLRPRSPSASANSRPEPRADARDRRVAPMLRNRSPRRVAARGGGAAAAVALAAAARAWWLAPAPPPPRVRDVVDGFPGLMPPATYAALGGGPRDVWPTEALLVPGLEGRPGRACLCGNEHDARERCDADVCAARRRDAARRLERNCEVWAEQGACATNAVSMLKECAVACAAREPCRDLKPHCDFWASGGECPRNPGYMNQFCPVACGACGVRADPRKRCHDLFPDWSVEGDARRADPQAYLDGVFSRARDALAAGADANGDGPRPEATVLSRDPWVLQVDGFLSAAERDDARATLHELETLKAPDRRADEPYPRRTASYAWCLADCRRAPVFARLAARVAALGGCGSVNHTDSFHLAHLRPREQLGRHHDFLDDEVMRPGGPRLLAFKFFLDDVADGGALRFPELGFDVAPRAGRALVYALVRGDDLLAPDLRTQVEYLPVWTAGPGADASQILETWTHLHDYRGPHLHSCLGPHAAYDSELIGDQGAGAAPATPTPDDAK